MKNLNEQIEKINRLANYQVGVVINEQTTITKYTNNFIPKVGDIYLADKYYSVPEKPLEKKGQVKIKINQLFEKDVMVSIDGVGNLEMDCSQDCSQQLPGVKIGITCMSNSYDKYNILKKM